jgi:hypothetical protein
MPLLEAALAEVLGDAVTAAGTWLAKAVAASRGRPGERDRAIAEWFDEYELARGLAVVPVLPDGLREETVAAWLESHETRAILQELIVVRLTDAPPTDIDRVRQNLRYACLDTFPELGTEISYNLSDAIFEAADHEILELMGRIESSNPKFRQKVRQGAFAGRSMALLQAIERHTDSQAERTPAARIKEREFIEQYRRIAEYEHGFLQPPDFEQRRQVPIKDLYVVPDIVTEASDQDATSQSSNIWTFGANVDRSVLLGDPGGGKSTAVNVLINRMAVDQNARVPLLVVLREYARTDPPAESVLSYIESRLQTHYQCLPPEGLIERLLLAGKATVFFDGLDELVDTRRRREVSQRVENFCMQYPLTPTLVTSRRIGYGQARLDPAQFTTSQLGPFSAHQAEKYATKWFSQERRLSDQEPSKWAAAFILESAALPDLRSNPLMLALLCIIYRGEGSLPRNRPAVYERCATLLFETWDASRSINVDLRARDLIEPALRHLAHWLLIRGEATPVVTEEQLATETANYLAGRLYEDVGQTQRAAREFVEFCKGRAWVFSEVGSTAEGDPLFTFSHRTFLEYFAASYLSSVSDTPEQLAETLEPHITRQEWDVVAQLALQIKNRNTQDGAVRFFIAELAACTDTSNEKPGNVLDFLVRCLAFLDLPPRIIRELSDRSLDYLLVDPKEESRRRALGSLMINRACRETVSERIVDGLRKAIDSGPSSSTFASATHLTVLLQSTFQGVVTDLDENVKQETTKYWSKIGAELATNYKKQIVKAAHADESLRFAAYYRGWVGAREFANTPSTALEGLFKGNIPTGVANSQWIDVASSLVMHCMQPAADFLPGVNWQLEQITDIIRELGSPPWISIPTDGYFMRYASERYKSRQDSSAPIVPLRITRKAWTGAALLAMMLFEGSTDRSEQTPDRRIPGAEEWGELTTLRPYIVCRDKGSGAPPSDPLNIDPEFSRLFVQWATTAVNFVRLKPARRKVAR